MPQSNDLPPLSDAQLEIMHVIWEHAACSVATVWKALHDRRGVSRNTVHTLIVRLEEKGWLVHDETPGGFSYRATVSREVAQRGTVERMVDTLFAGSASGLVLALLEGGKL
ncbi:MAG TPA: BlaI/MecI/CopY family transcriptional regulator, partial [Pirellulales bacterium]|nr:BlaI/MecI/CopY family transcriptional regulator [Pirellulales bacterium]